MNDQDALRLRIVELELALKEGLKTIEWFEGWLNNRDVPVRYDPDDMQKHPPRFTVNYNAREVAMMREFISKVLAGGDTSS